MSANPQNKQSGKPSSSEPLNAAAQKVEEAFVASAQIANQALEQVAEQSKRMQSKVVSLGSEAAETAKQAARKTSVQASVVAKKASEKVSAQVEQASKKISEVVEYSREVSEQLTQNVRASTEATRKVALQAVEQANQTFARNAENLSRIIKAKNIGEVFEIQRNQAKQWAETACQNAARAAEAVLNAVCHNLKTANEAVQKAAKKINQ